MHKTLLACPTLTLPDHNTLLACPTLTLPDHPLTEDVSTESPHHVGQLTCPWSTHLSMVIPEHPLTKAPPSCWSTHLSLVILAPHPQREVSVQCHVELPTSAQVHDVLIIDACQHLGHTLSTNHTHIKLLLCSGQL